MRNRYGFTLVELLVVIAIISVLAGLLLPALEEALNSARQVKCLSQIKQQSVFLTLYSSDCDDVMPADEGNYMEGHHALHTHWPDHMWYSWGTMWLGGYVEDLNLLACPTYTGNSGAKLLGNNSRNSSRVATTPSEVVANLQVPINQLWRADTTYVLMGHAPRNASSTLPNVSGGPLKQQQLPKHSPVPLSDYLFWNTDYWGNVLGPPETHGHTSGWVHRNEHINVGVYDGHAEKLDLSEVGMTHLNNIGLYHGRTDPLPVSEGFWNTMRTRFGQ